MKIVNAAGGLLLAMPTLVSPATCRGRAMFSATLKTGIRLSGGVSANWVKRLDWFLSRKKSAWMQIIPLKEMEPELGPLVTKDVTR